MIALGPQACGSLDEAASREWLVADGLGGYAMGTVAGLRTRRYHGLLVQATGGPSARMLGLAALDPVLVVDALLRYARYFGDGLTLEYPTGSGEQRTFAEIGEDLRRRLISLFLIGEDGRRPCHGWVDKLQTDPAWKDNIFFYEYFHGDNGAGLGASHQTGWTGIVADLIRRHGGGDVPTIGDVLDRLLGPVAP